MKRVQFGVFFHSYAHNTMLSLKCHSLCCHLFSLANLICSFVSVLIVTIEVHVLYQISRVAFGILASNFGHFSSITSSTGSFDGGNSFMHTTITKWDVRRRLVFICKFATSARPSRGNLKQVFGFLSREQESAIIAESALDAT